MRDLVQDFLERMDTRSPQSSAEVSGRSSNPPKVAVAPDPAPDAPSDQEYLAAWRESVMPMQEYGCEEGCCDVV